jgi:hypothetical protein
MGQTLREVLDSLDLDGAPDGWSAGMERTMHFYGYNLEECASVVASMFETGCLVVGTLDESNRFTTSYTQLPRFGASAVGDISFLRRLAAARPVLRVPYSGRAE